MAALCEWSQALCMHRSQAYGVTTGCSSVSPGVGVGHQCPPSDPLGPLPARWLVPGHSRSRMVTILVSGLGSTRLCWPHMDTAGQGAAVTRGQGPRPQRPAVESSTSAAQRPGGRAGGSHARVGLRHRVK